MNRFYERSFPTGYSYRPELKAVTGALAVSVLISLFSFWNEYSFERQGLYIRRGTDLILDKSRIMPDFIHILGDKLNILLVLAGFILMAAPIIHYAYYHSGSKSIYLMRRLPNKFELHRRSLLIPLLSALIFVLTAAAMLLIYYAVYMNFTPESCLTPDQWQKIWRVFR